MVLAALGEKTNKQTNLNIAKNLLPIAKDKDTSGIL